MTAAAFADAFWTVAHVVGFVAMIAGWRTYRQRLYAYSAVGWFLMASWGVTVDSASPAVRFYNTVIIQIGASSAGLLAIGSSMFTLRRRVTTIVSASGETVRLRQGGNDVHVVEERDTIRPPSI